MIEYVPYLLTLLGCLCIFSLRDGRELLVPVFFLPWMALEIDLGFVIEVSQVLMILAMAKFLLFNKDTRFELPLLHLAALFLIISIFSALLTLTIGPEVPEFHEGATFQNDWGRVFVQFTKWLIYLLFMGFVIGASEKFRGLSALRILIFSTFILASTGLMQFAVYTWGGVDLFPTGMFLGEEMERTALVAPDSYLRITSFAGEPKGLGLACAIALLLLFQFGGRLGFKPAVKATLYGVCAVALVLTASASGFFVLAIAGAIAISAKVNPRPLGRHGLWGFATVAILFFTAAFLLFADFDVRVERYGTHRPANVFEAAYERTLTRVELMDSDQLIMQSFAQDPVALLLGRGLGLQHHYTVDLIPERQMYYMWGNIIPAKSGVTEWVGSAGIVGAILLAIFLINLVPHRRARTPRADWRELRALQGMGLSLFVAVTLSWFTSTMVFVLLAVLYGMYAQRKPTASLISRRLGEHVRAKRRTRQRPAASIRTNGKYA